MGSSNTRGTLLGGPHMALHLEAAGDMSPRRDEIAAIFAKVLPSVEVGVPKRQAEWDALSAEVGAADAKCRTLSDATNDLLTKEVQAAEDEVWPIYERLSDCAQRILAEPVHASADLMLLAEASCPRRRGGFESFPRQ
jgi:hypothetical protein